MLGEISNLKVCTLIKVNFLEREMENRLMMNTDHYPSII